LRAENAERRSDLKSGRHECTKRFTMPRDYTLRLLSFRSLAAHKSHFTFQPKRCRVYAFVVTKVFVLSLAVISL